MNITSSDSSDISEGKDEVTERKKSVSSKASVMLSNKDTSKKSTKRGYVLDDEDDKNDNQGPVTGSLIQHELNFFEFETKMRKVMYDIIEPNVKNTNGLTKQINELEKQLKRSNQGMG